MAQRLTSMSDKMAFTGAANVFKHLLLQIIFLRNNILYQMLHALISSITAMAHTILVSIVQWIESFKTGNVMCPTETSIR